MLRYVGREGGAKILETCKYVIHEWSPKFEFSHPELNQAFVLVFVRKKIEFLASKHFS